MVERSRRSWSARARIVVWLVVLVGTVLGVNLVVAARLVQARAAGAISDELSHEYDKLATFVRRSGVGAARVDQLLTTYLASAFPEEDESYFTLVQAQPDRRSANPFPVRLDRDRAFIEEVAAATHPRSGTWTIGETELRYGVFPVSIPGDDRDAAFVVAKLADRDATRATIGLLSVISLGSLAVAAAVSWFVAGRLLLPIQAVSDAAERISESDLTRRIEVHGDNDVADLARTFNRMLDRIARAFDGQRQFLDDAGHELRTPLTVVRGHLEVMGEDPEERTRVVPLVIGELNRMSRIVDDLLVLARAERPDFLDPSPVDLADLTVSVVATSRSLAQRRWSVDEVATATAVVDGQRLTQALVQLVANAVDHTGAGDPIGVGSRVAERGVELWVRDGGCGIAAEDHQRIFDRFATAGARHSSGLGLTIVTSIAEAHGGSVLVDSEVGVGSTFTLVLPRHCLVPSDDIDDIDDDIDDAAPSPAVEPAELGGPPRWPAS